MESGAASAKGSSERREYIDACARVVSSFANIGKDDLLVQIPALMAREFDADRAELWLWDDSSNSAYLVYSAGVAVERKHDYITSGSGAIGRVGKSKCPIENVSLASLGGDDQVFSKTS